MSIWGYARGVWNALLGRVEPQPTSPWPSHDTSTEIYSRYDGFDIRYSNKDYEELASILRDAGEIPEGYEAIRSLRNPVNRVVEVYAANLLPEDLLDYLIPPPDSTNNVKPLKPLIGKIWDAADWKEEARRAYPTHGELWIKAVSSEDKERVYPQILNPRHIMDFDKNERGYLTYIRIDVPRDRRLPDGDYEEYLHVEVWDKDSATYTVWEALDKSPGEDLEELGTPKFTLALSEIPNGSNGFTGYDFIPIVHTKFKSILGQKRGVTPYEHALANIDKTNEIVTRLHAMMFPDIVWVLGRTGPEGEPLQPIRLEGIDASAALTEAEEQNIRVVDVRGEKVIRLPANATFEPKVPAIDFGSHIAAITEEMLEIERAMPELAYYRLRELELSGYAIELSLKDLIDRIRAARANLERGLVRFNQMAITIAQSIKIEEFAAVGTFEEEALEHAFEDRDVFTPVEKDKAEVNTLKAALWRSWADLGILEEMLVQEEGMSAAEAKKIAAKVRPSNIPGLDLFGTGEPGTGQPRPDGEQPGQGQGEGAPEREQGQTPPRPAGQRTPPRTR